jgi:hypothetical protein
VIVCRSSTPPSRSASSRVNDRQLDSLPQLPDDLLTGHNLTDDAEHPHPTLPDVLIHQHDVAEVIATAGQRMQLQVGSRPPLPIAVVSAVEQEVGDLPAADPGNENRDRSSTSPIPPASRVRLPLSDNMVGSRKFSEPRPCC